MSGLYNYRARYYDAGIGRFIGKDPVGFKGGDTNLYSYVKNQPVNFNDPSGKIIPAVIGACALGGCEAAAGALSGITLAVFAKYGWDAWIANSESDENTDGETCANPSSQDKGNLEEKVKKIAKETGLTEEEVKDAIHRAKEYLPKGTKTKNPNVGVDIETGEIYPKVPGGGYGDSIGNIYDKY